MALITVAKPLTRCGPGLWIHPHSYLNRSKLWQRHIDKIFSENLINQKMTSKKFVNLVFKVLNV